MTTKRQRSAAASPSFERALAIVRSSRSVVQGLAKFRLEASPELLRATAPQFANHPAYRAITLKAPFPAKAGELPNTGFRYMASFQRELAWLTGLLKLHGQKLRTFTKTRDRFEHLYFVGDYAAAEQALDAFDLEFGFSCWSTQRRMDLLAQAPGSTARSRQLTDAFASGGPSVARYLLTWFGYRTTSAVSKREFDAYILEAAPLKTGLHFLLHADSGLYPALTTKMARAMIAWTDVLPLVDRYQLLLVILQMLAANDDLADADRSAIVTNGRILETAIDDPRLGRILFAVGEPFAARPSDAVLSDMLDAYSSGDYSGTIQCLQSDSTGHTVERLNIALRAHILSDATTSPVEAWTLDPKSIVGRVATDLHEVLRFSDSATDARLRLSKLALNYSGHAWAASLLLILDRQRHDERVKTATRAQRINALRCTSDHPILAFAHAAPGRTEAYLSGFSAMNPGSLTAVALGFVVGLTGESSPHLPAHRTGHLQALRAMRTGDPVEAASSLERLVRLAPTNVLRNEAELLLVECRLGSGDVAGACELAANLFVDRRYFGLVLPVTALMDAIMTGHNAPMSKSPTRGLLSVAVVFDIYSRFISADRDAERADSFNDVLRRYGVKNASHLPDVVLPDCRRQLVYFLRYLCVPQVMDQSLVLDGTRLVEDERLAVLQSLIELAADEGPQALEAFKDEIREIRTRQVVKDTTLKLDQSKIYVNVEGIRRSIDVQLRETWARYRFMVVNGSDIEYEEVDRIMFSADDAADVVVLTLNTPYSERAAVFKRMVSEIRDQFTSNKEFGLNSNLSANIRHGYVLRELRAPLVNRNLVTNKISSEQGYQPNTYWADRLDISMVDLELGLQDKLSDFSAKVDDMIEHLNRVLLRIRSEANPAGLFNYTLSDNALRSLDGPWGALDNYDEFMAAVLEAMWVATEHNLKNVRNKLSGEILQKFIDAIDDLDTSLNGLGVKDHAPAIGNAITMAKTDMRAAIERVASWFTLSAAHDYADYDLNIAAQAGLASVRAYYADLEIVASYNGPDDPIMLQGWSLPAVARLLFQLLDNAAQHGGRGRDHLSLTVEAEQTPHSVMIKVINDLPEDLSREHLQQTVEAINADYGQAKAMDLFGEEGGSGYPKVLKLLRADLKRDHDVQVSLEDDQFQVEILMNSGGITCRPS